MNVAILGLGLMGGSLGLALRKRGLARVTGYARRAETRREALRLGIADACAGTPGEAVRSADVVVVCTPVLTIPGLIRECLPALAPGCVMTDVGSTKLEVQRQAEAALQGSQAAFVGSHPMAGSEKTGIEWARADLYENAVTVLTPSAASSPSAMGRVRQLWEAVGARVTVLDPAVHDDIVARTSHLPHLIASLLATVAGREQSEAVRSLCGPGFRDATRIAAGSPEMWHDIVKSNRSAVLAELQAFGGELQHLAGLIERSDFDGVKTLLEQGQKRRERLLTEQP